MSALRDPRFRRLLVGQSLSSFGDSALYLSLAIWAKDLTGSNAAGIGVLVLLAVQSRAQLWIIYAVAVGYGVTFTLLSAGMSGLLKDLLPAERLAGANASFQTVGQGLRLASPLAGAGICAAFGGGALAVLDAATFAAAVAVLCWAGSPWSWPSPSASSGSWRAPTSPSSSTACTGRRPSSGSSTASKAPAACAAG